MGIYVQSEVHTTRGRADSIVETDKYVYVFEFKIDQSAEIALQQIHEKDYARKYIAPLGSGASKKVILIGANFSTKTRYMDDWAVEIL